MAIQEFDNEEEARAVSDPKELWDNLGVWVVFTGEDIPKEPING